MTVTGNGVTAVPPARDRAPAAEPPHAPGTAGARPPGGLAAGPAAAGLVVGYLIVGLVLLPTYRYQLDPDGVPYLAIARDYADGYRAGGNGDWAPLYPGLLAPLLASGVDGLLAAKLLNLGLSSVAAAGLWMLTGRYTDSLGRRLLAVAAVLPALLGLAYLAVGPGVLLAAIAVWYLRALTTPGPGRTARYAAIAGGLGGLAGLAVPYAWPLALAPFAFMAARRWPFTAAHPHRAGERTARHSADRRAHRRSVVIAVALLAVIWTPAVGVLWAGRTAGWTDADTAERIRRSVPDIVGRRIASNASYRSSAVISYHLSARFYGLVPRNDGAAAEQLNQNSVDYLLLWGDGVPPAYLRNTLVVFDAPTEPVRVFRLR